MNVPQTAPTVANGSYNFAATPMEVTTTVLVDRAIIKITQHIVQILMNVPQTARTVANNFAATPMEVTTVLVDRAIIK